MKRYLVEVTVNDADDPNKMPDLFLYAVAPNRRAARREGVMQAEAKLNARAKRRGYSVVVVGVDSVTGVGR